MASNFKSRKSKITTEVELSLIMYCLFLAEVYTRLHSAFWGFVEGVIQQLRAWGLRLMLLSSEVTAQHVCVKVTKLVPQKFLDHAKACTDHHCVQRGIYSFLSRKILGLLNVQTCGFKSHVEEIARSSKFRDFGGTIIQ